MGMNVFEMVVIIVIVGALARVVSSWLTNRNRNRADELEDILDKLEQLEDLESRVRVLEAVVTDQNYDLKQQFSKLEKD